MNVSYGDRYGWTVVQVTGEVDITGVAALRERLQRLIAGGCDRVVIDLSMLAFCDSTGFAVLVAVRRLLVARGGRLRLVLPGPDTHVRKVLASFGIEKLFEVYPSAGEALTVGNDTPGALRAALPRQRNDTSQSAD
ncbi:STAS domain-containing protein [Streptacidiphilus sp. EB129]|uniref:STAS domain-containing protein n=1 Tax=Streptacidiphilus sp. EB129 TaxID=3156262 RepID=UPI0035155176